MGLFCRSLAPHNWISTESMTLSISFKESSKHLLPCLCTGRHMSVGICILTNFCQVNLFWKYHWQMAAKQHQECKSGNAHRDKLLLAVMGNFWKTHFIAVWLLLLSLGEQIRTDLKLELHRQTVPHPWETLVQQGSSPVSCEKPESSRLNPKQQSPELVHAPMDLGIPVQAILAVPLYSPSAAAGARDGAYTEQGTGCLKLQSYSVCAKMTSALPKPDQTPTTFSTDMRTTSSVLGHRLTPHLIAGWILSSVGNIKPQSIPTWTHGDLSLSYKPRNLYI